jgi:hypothetical protein
MTIMQTISTEIIIRQVDKGQEAKRREFCYLATIYADGESEAPPMMRSIKEPRGW